MYGVAVDQDAIRSVDVDALDLVEKGVAPVEMIRLVVERQPVGPQQLVVDESPGVGSVHSRRLDKAFTGPRPVGPIHSA